MFLKQESRYDLCLSGLLEYLHGQSQQGEESQSVDHLNSIVKEATMLEQRK